MTSNQETKKTKGGSSRNSDKRRERSKVAARCRRGKETEIFSDLSLCLPISETTRSSLDKASIMRLSLCHLKLQEIIKNDFKNDIENALESGCRKYDSFLTDALGGFCLMLTIEGDFIYASSAVTTYLGLTDVELMKCSIYEFTHPEDHKEIKELLAVSKKDNEGEDRTIRSVSFRMKCTITSRGRNVHVRSATYKVINCRGRTFGTSKDPSSRWFGGVAEVLPHPSDVDIPLNKQTFLSKHSLDLKYEEVDECIKGFLGYSAEDLIGKSFFEFLNFSKDEISPLSKVFSSLHSKGQAITEIYRFLAKHGGWVWVRTLATVLYANNGTTPTSIVCLHFIASGIEHQDEILSYVQHPVKSDDVISTSCKAQKEDTKIIPESNSIKLVNENKENVENINESVINNPIASTLKVFTRKTEDMDKGFLIPYDNTMIESKEDQQDLTHLALMAGDECVELDPPMLDDLLETLDQAEIEYTFDGLIVDVNADELPPMMSSKTNVIQNGADIDVHYSGRESSASITNSPLFLHSDPHMTLSPDSKSLLSPFQNSNSSDCKNNICDMTPDDQKLCLHGSVPSVAEKSQFTEFVHKVSSDILPVETTAEDDWHQNTWTLLLTDLNDYVDRRIQREATDIAVPTNNVSITGMHKPTVGLDTPELLHSSALSQSLCKTLSPNVCSNSITGLHVETKLPQNQATQLDHLDDGDSKWKTKERNDKKSFAKLIIRKSCDGSEFFVNSVANSPSTTIPPEILRKKANFDLKHDLIASRMYHQMAADPKGTVYCREDNVPTVAEGLHIQNTTPNFCKRRKLVNKQEDGTIPCEMMLRKEHKMTCYPNDEALYCKTERKRNFLGRLLCTSSPNGRLSLCELTRQDYEVNAPLGDNCCLSQGPDILTALDNENITDSIL